MDYGCKHIAGCGLRVMSCGGFRPGGTTDTSPPIYRWVHQPPLTLRPGGTFETVHGEKETTALNMGIGWIYLCKHIGESSPRPCRDAYTRWNVYGLRVAGVFVPEGQPILAHRFIGGFTSPPLTLRPGGTFEMVHGEKETTALNMGIGWIYLHVSSRCGIHGVTILFLFLSSSLGTHL